MKKKSLKALLESEKIAAKYWRNIVDELDTELLDMKYSRENYAFWTVILVLMVIALVAYIL